MPTFWPYPGGEVSGALVGSNNTTLMQPVDTALPLAGFLMSQYSGLEGAAPPPPPTGDHAHFDSLVQSPNHVASASLRTIESIEALAFDINNYAQRWSVDPTYDAARMRFPVGQNMSNGTQYQLALDFPAINIGLGTTFSCQWELMYSPAYLDTSPAACGGWSGLHKAFRLDNRQGTGPLNENRYEFNFQSLTRLKDGFTTIPRIRTATNAPNRLWLHSAYFSNTPLSLYLWDDEGNLPAPPIPIGVDDQPSIRTALDRNTRADLTVQDYFDMQAGDVLKPYLFRPLVWTRLTFHYVYFGPGELRLELWCADEDYDPVQILGQKDTNDGKAGQGINNYYPGTTVVPGVPGSGDATLGDYNIDNQIDRWRQEWNSSNGGTGVPTPYDIWTRNMVVWANAKIPLGGRPVKT